LEVLKLVNDYQKIRKNVAERYFSYKLDKRIVALCLVVVLLFIYCIILSGRISKANNEAEELSAKVDELTQENLSLQNENEVLQEKVSILSETLNEKVQQEEETAQTYVPKGFPLKGTASYNEDETQLDGNPIAVFHASKGTSVIAAGNGTVTSIEKTDEGIYVISIDHGNGYISVYRNGSKPKVSEGDEVTKSTELYDIEEGNEELGYQIIQDGEYIDPLELMEIYG
jgi:murein DD-endopeptidase MepM/ murein hydrolase activator NlpD